MLKIYILKYVYILDTPIYRPTEDLLLVMFNVALEFKLEFKYVIYVNDFTC